MELNNTFIKKEYRKLLLPVMFSIMGVTITGLIDSCLVAMKLGGNAVTAINLCLPIAFITGTIGLLISGGASLLAAEAAGEQKMDQCSKYFNTSIFMIFVAGLIVTVVGVIANNQIALFLSQGTELFELVRAYGLVLFIGTIPFAIAYIPIVFLQLEGNGKVISVMIIMIIVIDAVCDYLFLYVIPIGMYGAALASLLSMAISSTYGLFCLSKGANGFQINLKEFRVYDLKNILINGISIASNNIFDILKLLILNSILLSWGGLTISCIWSIINIFGEMSRTISSGVPETTGPIVSVLHGAKENDTIRNLIKLSAKDGMLLSLVAAIILISCNGVIRDFYHIGASMLIPMLCLAVYIIFELHNNIWMNALYRTSRPFLSIVGTMVRNFIMPVVVVLVITHTFGVIWLFLPIAQVLAMLVMLLVTTIISGKSKGNHRLSSVLLLDDYLKRTNTVLDFSIVPTDENICDASEKIQGFCSENMMSPKLVMRLGLAIEEMFIVIRDLNPGMASADVRIYNINGDTGLRVRSPGNSVNIFVDDFRGDAIGVDMIKNMASEISYNYILGFNNYDIHF